MDESLRMLEISIRDLSDQELWNQPNEHANSIANLILHLCGNIHQYVISGLGREEDVRERQKEFDSREMIKKELLFKKISDTVNSAKQLISSSSAADLLTYFKIQAYELSGVGIIVHVVEHLSYHTGQIALLTKLLKNNDLGFYTGVDLD
jgi:uncharacterized damage-inducible protein DinB